MVPISLKKMFSFAKIRPMNFLRFIFSKSLLRQIVLAIVACIIFSFLALKWLKSYTNHGTFVEVPNLVGLSLDDAETTLQNFDLRTQVQDSSNYNPKYASGAVIEQEPLAGAQVKENRKIYLILNPSDYRKVIIPDVIRSTLRQTRPTLEALGFRIGKLIYIDDLGRDEVLELRFRGQKINAGDMIKKTSAIDLVLGNGNRKLN
jgi:eukaryotic-like serine/threonine-protein kinase